MLHIYLPCSPNTMNRQTNLHIKLSQTLHYSLETFTGKETVCIFLMSVVCIDVVNCDIKSHRTAYGITRYHSVAKGTEE